MELELKAEKENAEVRVDNVEEYQKVVDAEWNILYEKLDLIVKSGAKVVLSKLPIGDVATQVSRNPGCFYAAEIVEHFYLCRTSNTNTDNFWLLVFC